jgi:hypothetical protein
MTNNLEQLEQLLCLLEKHNVVEFSDGTLTLTIKPKVAAPVDAKDLAKTNKTKEQEEEELLFYSAAR